MTLKIALAAGVIFVPTLALADRPAEAPVNRGQCIQNFKQGTSNPPYAYPGGAVTQTEVNQEGTAQACKEVPPPGHQNN